jgi:hypothetical protein
MKGSQRKNSIKMPSVSPASTRIVPEVQKFLFKHGMIPKQEWSQERNQGIDNTLQCITRDKQSIHIEVVAKRTNVFAKNLVESIKASKEQLQQQQILMRKVYQDYLSNIRMIQ